jgi:hypothetical protein
MLITFIYWTIIGAFVLNIVEGVRDDMREEKRLRAEKERQALNGSLGSTSGVRAPSPWDEL